MEFDIRGQICPSTLLFALKQVNEHSSELQSGELGVVIKTDNRHATSTIPESVSNMGYTVDISKVEGYYVIEIRAPE